MLQNVLSTVRIWRSGQPVPADDHRRCRAPSGLAANPLSGQTATALLAIGEYAGMAQRDPVQRAVDLFGSLSGLERKGDAWRGYSDGVAWVMSLRRSRDGRRYQLGVG